MAGTELPEAEERENISALVRLLLALAMGLAGVVLALRAIAGGTAPGRASAPGATHADTIAATPVSGTGGALYAGSGTPAGGTAQPDPSLLRTYFASLAYAQQDLGFRVLQPDTLPSNATTLAVAWQPDDAMPQPGLAPSGVLLSWYFTWDRGVVLLLAQGPGRGLSDAGAPAGEHGAATLADGRQVLWVRGHAQTGAIARGPSWGGDELRVGVPADGQATGWWLESRALSLSELITIAEGLH
jgi:hypothetical protein